MKNQRGRGLMRGGRRGRGGGRGRGGRGGGGGGGGKMGGDDDGDGYGDDLEVSFKAYTNLVPFSPMRVKPACRSSLNNQILSN